MERFTHRNYAILESSSSEKEVSDLVLRSIVIAVKKCNVVIL